MRALAKLTVDDHVALCGATEVGGAFVSIHQRSLWHHQKVRVLNARAAAAITGAVRHQGVGGGLSAHVEVVRANAREEKTKIRFEFKKFFRQLT